MLTRPGGRRTLAGMTDSPTPGAVELAPAELAAAARELVDHLRAVGAPDPAAAAAAWIRDITAAHREYVGRLQRATIRPIVHAPSDGSTR